MDSPDQKRKLQRRKLSTLSSEITTEFIFIRMLTMQESIFCNCWMRPRGERGALLALFPHVGGGIATPNTPPKVSYFLDQAYKAEGGSAITAAVVMYRAALEQILKNQGFKRRYSRTTTR